MSKKMENMIKNERRDYCLENVEKGLKVVFENKSLKFFTSVLQNTAPDTERVVGEDFRFDLNAIDDGSVVIDYMFGLFGDGFKKKVWYLNDMVELFEFFSALEMRSWELSILKQVEQSNDVEHAVLFFKKTYEKYENPASSRPLSIAEISVRKNSQVEEEVQLKLKSPFTTVLFNRLSKQIKKIRKNRSYMRIFETAGVWGDLINWKKKEMKEEERYSSVTAYSRIDLKNDHLKHLYDNLAKFHNFIIVSADEKEIPVHKEIIVLFSDYFYQIIKFGGAETRREGYLILENLNHEELNLLVGYIYKKSFDCQEEDLVTCLNLLKELMDYPNENETQEALKNVILTITKSQIQRDTFFSLVLPEIGFMFHTERLTFPLAISEFFLDAWSELADIEKGQICQIVHRSLMEQEKKMEIESLSERFDEKFVQIDNRFQKIEGEFRQIVNDVKEIKSTLSGIVKKEKELKRKRKRDEEEEFVPEPVPETKQNKDEEIKIVPRRMPTRLSSRRRKIRKFEGDLDISSNDSFH